MPKRLPLILAARLDDNRRHIDEGHRNPFDRTSPVVRQGSTGGGPLPHHRSPGLGVRESRAASQHAPGDCDAVCFRLGDAWFAAMDGGSGHGFRFNEAVSFVVSCRDQAKIDHYWEKLSAAPEAEACGRLEDRYGISWQIVPAEPDEMIGCADRARLDRLVRALLGMRMLDLAALRAAWAAPA